MSMMLCTSLTAFAQQTVKGVVTDAGSGEPLPGVSVVVKGTMKGASTDFDGNYDIKNVNKGEVLTFSYVGFETVQITVGNKTTINVALKESAESLEEVVVVGYGTASKKDLTGSVNLVNEKDFNKAPTSDPSGLIQGKIAGVQVTSNGGAPGENQAIRIRGNGSLSLANEPLLVVDGVPSDMGLLNTINPNDVASMTVLKDASSTAIYGSRAANGILLITTKKGKSDQPFKVNLDFKMSYSFVDKYVDVMDAEEFSSLIKKNFPADADKLGNSNTDWQKEIYQGAPTSDVNLSFSGGLKDIPYRLSLGHTNQEGVLKTDKFQRTNAKLSLTPSFLDGDLKLEVNAGGSYIDRKMANRGAIGAAVMFDPTQSIYDESHRSGYFTWTNGTADLSLAPTNPLALLNLEKNHKTEKRFIGNAKVDYTLPFLPEMTATINVGLDKYLGEGTIDTDKVMPKSVASLLENTFDYKNDNTNKLFDAYVNYKKTFEEKHNLNMMIGHSYQNFHYYTETTKVEKHTEAKKNINQHNIDESRSVLVSFFGRMNYGYDNRYLVTATLRADASSKLNPDDRWGYFPSVALAWNISNEEFLKDSETVDNLKLRLGYGEVGNVNGLGDYKFITNYTKGDQFHRYKFGNEFYDMYRPSAVSKDLKWEVGNTKNIGLDYSFFNRRVFGSVDAYIKTTKDLIANVSIDPLTNFSNRIDRNIGTMTNKGVEIALNVKPIESTEDFDWTVNYNFAYNQNKVDVLTNTIPVGDIDGATGNKVQLQKEGEVPNSFYLFRQIYDEAGRPIEGLFLDVNKDGQINTGDLRINEAPYAGFTMGLGTSVNYKRFDFNATSRLSIGNYVYNNIASNLTPLVDASSTGVLRNRSRAYFESGFVSRSTNNFLSDYFLENASFFKLDNITLGYTFPKGKNVSTRLYATMQNVLTITNYKGLDPEINGGIENNFYPRPRVVLVGLNINF